MEQESGFQKETSPIPSLEEAQKEAIRLYEAKKEKELLPVEPKKEKRAFPLKQEKEKLEQVLTSSQLPPEAGEKISAQVVKLQTLPPQKQVETLVTLAFEKSPLFAVEVARRLDNAFVLDSLHDLLASDKLYERLIRAQKL